MKVVHAIISIIRIRVVAVTDMLPNKLNIVVKIFHDVHADVLRTK